jgi:polysaccharide deacetylase family protein (PEP-CTERM system associated)
MTILNGLSFDIEDWFQVENLKGAISSDQWDSCDLRVVANTRKILALLKLYDTKATFFILGWIAERCPALVVEIAEEGHEIASHGYGHDLVYTQTPEEFRRDIRRSKELLEGLSGAPVSGYRAPSFSITPETPWAIDVLVDEGFTYDSSVFPTSFHDRYGFNGSSRFPFRYDNGLVEVPLSTVRFGGKNIPAAGGGYFRLFPYLFFRHLAQRLNEEGRALVFYLHPWELDPEQPRIPIRHDYRFRHYVNLCKTEQRLNRLMGDFAFVPLAELTTNVISGEGTTAASE